MTNSNRYSGMKLSNNQLYLRYTHISQNLIIAMKYFNYQIDEAKLGGKDIRANVVHEIGVVQDVQFEVETITVCLLYTHNYKKMIIMHVIF